MGLPSLFNPGYSLSHAEIEFFRVNGFVVVKGVFDRHEIGQLTNACDELTKMAADRTEDFYVGACYFNMHRDCNPFDSKVNAHQVVKGELRRVTYPYLVNQTINYYRTQTKLLQAVQSLLGPNVVQIVNQVNFNPPQRGTGWGWHQDYRFRRPTIHDMNTNYVQTLTALDRAGSFNGGLRLVPESPKLGGFKLDQEQDKAETYFDAKSAVTPELEPGDICMFGPYMIHGSTPNRSDLQRRVFINGFANADQCDHGLPVLNGGVVIKTTPGLMEYEQQTEKLPLASKY
jgi:ectoine hydroxylase-related dioxygenase (phytanoyl-CoA dioxygenase family)